MYAITPMSCNTLGNPIASASVIYEMIMTHMAYNTLDIVYDIDGEF